MEIWKSLPPYCLISLLPLPPKLDHAASFQLKVFINCVYG
jgi:hypothetical protein